MIAQVTATCHDSLPVDKNIIWNSVDSELRHYRSNLILIEPIMESTKEPDIIHIRKKRYLCLKFTMIILQIKYILTV